MKTGEGNKCLRTLERVKGIEPSYSAWKAAALPLSYTRASRDHLTRPPARLNCDELPAYAAAVLAGLVPAIHVLLSSKKESHGCPGHMREDALRALARP